MKFRGYQEEDYTDLTARIENGARRLLFEGSVGYGKSLIIERLVHEYADQGEPVLVLSNRRAVVDQLRKRAAGKSLITTSTVQGIPVHLRHDSDGEKDDGTILNRKGPGRATQYVNGADDPES